MKLNKSSKLIPTGVFFIMALSLGFAFLTIGPKNADAITVGPVKLEYSVNPGDTVTGEMFIKNEEKEDRIFYPSLDRFTEQNGNKVFTKDKNLLADWFHTDASVTLKSGEDKKVPFQLIVPAYAPPGGEFAVIWWGTNPPTSATSSEQQVSIQTRAGILMYVNVSGKINNAASIFFARYGLWQKRFLGR